MKYLVLLFAVLLSSAAHATCTITVGIVTTSPAQNNTRTFTDTDANCVLALQALIEANTNKFGNIPTAAQAFTLWAQGVVRDLVRITTDYQKRQVNPTPINPQ